MPVDDRVGPSGPPHARDIAPSDLQTAIDVAPRPDLLLELVDASRHVFGFFTGHFPHTINYPWAIQKLQGLPPGSHLADIGSGISPVPLVLAARGYKVDCIDSHRNERKLPAGPDWNEWGFFDYSGLHQNLASHHCDVAEFTPPAPFDAIYSISVLAHITRVVREDTLRRCRDWLRPGGCLLFAIDVIPSSDFLWNRSEGLEVEPPIQHGTVADVVEQLAELGFEINESKVVRGVYKSRTDLLFISLHSKLLTFGRAQGKARRRRFRQNAIREYRLRDRKFLDSRRSKLWRFPVSQVVDQKHRPRPERQVSERNRQLIAECRPSRWQDRQCECERPAWCWVSLSLTAARQFLWSAALCSAWLLCGAS